MNNIERIVVPVDLDRNTDKLVDYAVTMAEQFGSRVSFVHGVDYVAMGEMALGNFSASDYHSAQADQAEKKLKDIVALAGSRCKECTGTVLIGDVVDEITAYAKKENADMIIIGTHGKRGLEKILLGSVAERVLKNAPCPVLVMNPYR